MITTGTIATAELLALELAQKDIELTPLPQGPIDKLVQASNMVEPITSVGYEKKGIKSQLINGSRRKDINGVYRHDVVLTELSDTVVDTVRMNLDLAKNTVNPLVKEAVAETEKYLRKSESLENNYIDVVSVFVNPIFKAVETEELLSRYVEHAYKDIELTTSVPYPTDKESLLRLALTGSKMYDKKIVKYFNSIPDETLAEIYGSVFSGTGVLLLTKAITTVDKAFIVHLFAKGLMSNPPEGVNMGLSEYRAYVSDILAHSGKRALSHITNLEQNVKYKRLIKQYPAKHMIGSKPTVITVDGEVYAMWLKEGGTPEALMGSACSTQLTDYNELLGAKEILAKIWSGKLKLFTTKDRLSKFNLASEAMHVAISEIINDLDDELLIVDRATLMRKLAKEVSTLHSRFYEEMYVHVRRVLCNTLFPHTDALRVLCAIDNVASDFPDMEINECALLATVELVGDWISEMINVRKVTGAE